jgi:imidazolonepropionase
VIEGGAVAFRAGKLVAVGPEAELRARFPAVSPEVHPSSVISPGLVDAHTHAAWIGSRSNEYALRMAGADYEAIAKAGGGIVASMRAVRGADPGDIAVELFARARRMRAAGVTTIEVKSGYGLDRENELKQLAAIRTLAARGDVTCPRVVPTVLGLHALPPEANGDRDAYAQHVTDVILPRVAQHGLARYADAYVDRSAFSAAQARPFLEKARSLGLGVRVHVGQFADVGGAELAAVMGAATVLKVGESKVGERSEPKNFFLDALHFEETPTLLPFHFWYHSEKWGGLEV